MSAKKQWNTPEKLHMAASMKKSIHRSIDRVNPIQYKNILKGENIFMYLCYQGETINSEYTKVALFMGAAVYKKATDKITVAVTNDSNHKAIKKLAAMSKPILSVLWLEACFQQKRKVPYEDFIFQEEKQQCFFEEQQSQEPNQTFQNLLQYFQNTIINPQSKWLQEKAEKIRFLKFVDKKQKINQAKQKYIIFPKEIDLGIGKRKSETVSEKMVRRKVQKKKNDHKSEGIQKKQENKTIRSSEDFTCKQTQNQQLNSQKDYVRQNRESTKLIYKKYLQDFTQYESKYENKDNYQTQIFSEEIDEKETPFFLMSAGKGNKKSNQEEEWNMDEDVQRENLVSTNNDKSVITKTCSMKKIRPKNRLIKFGIASLDSEIIIKKIKAINILREQAGIALIDTVEGLQKSCVAIVSLTSKVQILRAKIEEARMIISDKIISYLHQNPLIEITQRVIQQFQPKIQFNTPMIQGRSVVLLDSVMGASFIERVILSFGGKIVKVSNFLFEKQVDYVISNRKTFLKTDKSGFKVFTQGRFIDILIQIYQ